MIRDLAVSRLSLGCAPLAGLYNAVTPEQAEATLRTAIDNGITYFDTAPHYAVGLSEQRTGAVLSTLPHDSFVVSTKVGRLLEEGRTRGDIFDGAPDLHSSFDFSADGVTRSLEASLERLGLDRVDIVYVHDPDDHMDQALGEAFPTLRRWRDEGVVGAIGAGMNHAEPLTRIVHEADVDVVLLAGEYTLLDQNGERELLPLCAERGVRVTAAAVFNSGVLANPTDDATFFYSAAPPEIIDRARRMRDACANFGVSLPAAAMQFPLRHPAVETVLVGMRSPQEITSNTEAFNTPIPDELWAQLRSL